MIDSYLKNAVEMDDHVIHLLFSANRWEAAYGTCPLPTPFSLEPAPSSTSCLRPNVVVPISSPSG